MYAGVHQASDNKFQAFLPYSKKTLDNRCEVGFLTAIFCKLALVGAWLALPSNWPCRAGDQLRLYLVSWQTKT
jgi:hypothetical protein